jgi:hypothetical protein
MKQLSSFKENIDTESWSDTSQSSHLRLCERVVGVKKTNEMGDGSRVRHTLLVAVIVYAERPECSSRLRT